MSHIPQLNLRRLLNASRQRFLQDSLFRNSIYLITSTVMMSGFGFIFWMIGARFYSSQQIGLATSVVAITILLSNLAMAGMDSALIRYVPRAKRPHAYMSAGIVSVALLTLVATIIYLMGVHVFSPSLTFLAESPLGIAAFIALMIAIGVNTLTDSVFIAYRVSQYNVLIYGIFGLVRLGLSLLFVGLGLLGLLLSYGLAVVLALGLSLWFMIRRLGVRASWQFEPGTVRRLVTFSWLTHVAELLAGLPIMLMPVIVVNRFGASEAAYFYFAAMIAGLLAVVPSAIAKSQLAEGAHDEATTRHGAWRAVKIAALILLPAIAALMLLAGPVLHLFGSEYAEGGTTTLQLLALVALPTALNAIAATILKLQHKLWQLIGVHATLATVSIGLATLAPNLFGLVMALLAGQLAALVAFAAVLLWPQRKRQPQPAAQR